MSRSLKKGPYVDPRLLNKINLAKQSNSRVPIKTWSRDCVVAPEMVGVTVAIHNGKEHIPVFLIEDMVGHKLGEFAPTRKFRRHGGRMAREEAAAAVESENRKGAAVAEEESK